MIGWYVHHHGSGHLHRATAVVAALSERGEEVTVLSSLARPAGWRGGWVRLERDDAPPVVDPTANGRLHWVPVGSAGLSARAAQVSAWLAAHRPRLLVVDVSVEVAVLARLHGTPVVGVVLPGSRGDAAHLLGFDVAEELVAVWPAGAEGMLRDVPDGVLGRVRAVGGLSRFPVRSACVRRPGPPRVTVLWGTGGDGITPGLLRGAQAQTPGWEWTVLGPGSGSWTDDPFSVVAQSDVVVTHAGQNALAEVAAARRPAIVLPQERPHREQVTTADVLRDDAWPAVVVDTFPEEGWDRLLARARRLDGSAWSGWCDGGAAGRFADLLLATMPTAVAEPA